MFFKFGNCLKGAYKNDWEQVLNDNLPEANHESYNVNKHDQSKEGMFTNAIRGLIKKSSTKSIHWTQCLHICNQEWLEDQKLSHV